MVLILWIFFAVVAVEGANEGEDCDLYGERGICKNIKNCPTALEDIRRRKSPPPPTCGIENGDIIVCCKNNGDNVLTTTLRTMGPTTTEYVPEEEVYVDNVEISPRASFEGGCGPVPSQAAAQPTGQKAWDKCLEYQEKYVFPCEKSTALSGQPGRVNRCHHNADKLVIGGVSAALYEFPHMVLLGYKNMENDIKWQCGGTLISEKFVLTAGHCISDTSNNNVSHALIGILKRSEEAASNRYGIKRIIKHDLYQSPDKYHDIALLELDREVKLSDRTVPACLHTGEPVDESRASATGWGTTDATREANADVLQKVILTKFQSRECAGEYGYSRHMKKGYQEETQVCYGDRTKSQDTCRGDSGGPLQVKSRQIACMYVIVGVTSFGQECGWIGIPGIYTRVAHYVPWIESVVWQN